MNIVSILFYVVPFSNEMANTLASSGYRIFKDIYGDCVDGYTVNSRVLKKRHIDIFCTLKKNLFKIIFDLIALIGILFNVVAYSVSGGFFTGFMKGILLLLLSFIIPNMFLHKYVHAITHMLKLGNSKIAKLLFGFSFIAMLLAVSLLFDYHINPYISDKLDSVVNINSLVDVITLDSKKKVTVSVIKSESENESENESEI